MLLSLGRGLAPAGRGEGVDAAPLRLTDLVPGLTANWEVFNESLLDTTGNGHHLTLAGGATFATINGAAPGIGLSSIEQFISCHSLASSLTGEDTPFSLAYLVEQNDIDASYCHFGASVEGGGGEAHYFRARGPMGGLQSRRHDGSLVATANSADGIYNGALDTFIYEFSGSEVSVYKANTIVPGLDASPSETGPLSGLDQFFWGAQQADADPLPENNVPGKLAPVCVKVGGNFSSTDRAYIQGFLNETYQMI